MNCFSHLFTLEFILPFGIVSFEVFHCETHGTVPLLQLICYLSIVYGNGDGMGQLYAGMGGDGDSRMRGWMGTGTILKLVAGIGGGDGD